MDVFTAISGHRGDATFFTAPVLIPIYGYVPCRQPACVSYPVEDPLPGSNAAQALEFDRVDQRNQPVCTNIQIAQRFEMTGIVPAEASQEYLRAPSKVSSVPVNIQGFFK